MRIARSEIELIELAATLSAKMLMQCPLIIKGFQILLIGEQANNSRKVLMA